MWDEARSPPVCIPLEPPLAGPVTSLAANHDRLFAGAPNDVAHAWCFKVEPPDAAYGGAGGGGGSAGAGAGVGVGHFVPDHDHLAAMSEAWGQLPSETVRVMDLKCVTTDADAGAGPPAANGIGDGESGGAGGDGAGGGRRRREWLLLSTLEGEVVVWDLLTRSVAHFLADETDYGAAVTGMTMSNIYQGEWQGGWLAGWLFGAHVVSICGADHVWVGWVTNVLKQAGGGHGWLVRLCVSSAPL